MKKTSSPIWNHLPNWSRAHVLDRDGIKMSGGDGNPLIIERTLTYIGMVWETKIWVIPPNGNPLPFEGEMPVGVRFVPVEIFPLDGTPPGWKYAVFLGSSQVRDETQISGELRVRKTHDTFYKIDPGSGRIIEPCGDLLERLSSRGEVFLAPLGSFSL